MPTAAAAGTAVYPGGGNTFVKSHKATGGMVVAFSRNVNRFKLPKYVKYKTVEKDAGYYLRMTAENAARIVGKSTIEFTWPDGADRPRRNAGTEKFAFVDYRTERMDYDFTLGYKSMNQADWNIYEQEAHNHGQQAMTGRTCDVISALQTAGNWDASHTIDVDDISGVTGDWATSTSELQNIKKSLNYAKNLVHLHTLGAIAEQDYILVVNPVTAMAIGESQEIVNYVKSSPDAWKMIQGKTEGLNKQWGMPDELYGIPLVVEDAVVVTSVRGAATPTYSYAMSDGYGFLLSRPGGLHSDAPAASQELSTITLFLYEEMTVEKRDDPHNRRVEGHVVDDYAAAMTAPVSGFFFTGLL